MSRPRVTPGLLPELTAAAPARVVRRLDGTPRMAEQWTWADAGGVWTVTTEGGESVALKPEKGRLEKLEQLSCTCLLAPRCFHLLAVVGVLEIDDGSEPGDPAGDGALADKTAETNGAAARADETAETAGAAARADETAETNGAAARADETAETNGAAARADETAETAGAAARADETAAAGRVADKSQPVDRSPPTRVDKAQRRAALEAWQAGASFLAGGALGAGAIVQAELLRAVHECRAVGLHRIAAAGIRMVRAVRDLRADRPEFALLELSADLFEFLEAARVLAFAPDEGVDPQWLGIARRAYQPIGSLQLRGLFTEPVIAGSGYAGVITWLADAGGRIWSVSGVMPGEAARARRAYDGPIELGDVRLAHRQLCRDGLLLQGATGSPDFRLGSGAGVAAARSGASSWNDPFLAGLWRTPLSEQLDRAFAAVGRPEGAGAEGDALLFLQGVVLGAMHDALVVGLEARPDREAEAGNDPEAEAGNDREAEAGNDREAEAGNDREAEAGSDPDPASALAEGPFGGADDTGHADPVIVRCVAPSDHVELSYRDNLRLLARAPGARLRFIARLRPERACTVTLLAVGPAVEEVSGPADGAAGREAVLEPERPALALLSTYAGRCNLGLDRLQGSHFTRLAPGPRELEDNAPPADPLEPLRRRLHRAALGGRGTLPPEALLEVEREAARLEQRLMPAAAGILRQLGLGAMRGKGEAEVFARAWIAGMRYASAAGRALVRAEWER